MNLVTGEIVEIYVDAWTRMAKVSVNGVLIRVPLLLSPEVHVGHHVLIAGGVAIAVTGTA
ncbi:MAG TPA: HypC/HybG/HupF family hydrogenase formation chaperone [Nitrospiria bacterium]|nr:HypC/HybG/HupF family hydrogenase formation chaperone [Nitrospiria bacterium]